ncbi:radical SAM protein [Methanococcoides sp. SA1]|nr:radical SAM protein [Methanococcoides sp. SA1]
MNADSILLVEPNFPYSTKSKNKANSVHKNFIPIGLLKLGSYYKQNGHRVKLVRGNKSKEELQHDYKIILITTLFTYWSEYVWDCVEHYRSEFPNSQIIIGGIYATLHCKESYFEDLLDKYGVDVRVGLDQNAEECMPDYSLMEEDVDYHVMHAMRGCIRKCSFCGTWKIEPKRIDKTPDRVEKEILHAGKNKVILFDNNFLANKHIKQILEKMAKIRIKGKPVTYESQSGFDGRLLVSNPELATLLKKARFRNIRIAWDNEVSDMDQIELQIKHLTDAGYNSKELSVFMIYNYTMPLHEIIDKVKYCFKWRVQVTDCRYRPLTCVKDDYNPRKWKTGQTSEDYYIHETWSDRDIRLFRKLVRIHNITIRYVLSKIDDPTEIWKEIDLIKDPLTLLYYYENKMGYDREMERWSAIRSTYKFFGLGRPISYDKIKSNTELLDHIQLMNKVRSYSKKHNLSPSLKDLNFAEQKQKLSEFLVDNAIK